MAPILLILLSGLFEFGFMFNHYLAVLDAARNAARFSSDSYYATTSADTSCATIDFYRQAACEAMANLENEEPTITLCLPTSPASEHCDPADWATMDDIIISVFSVLRLEPTGEEIVRFAHADLCPEYGWSYAADLSSRDQCASDRTGLHGSQFTSAEIGALLDDRAPNTGFVLVEINFNYNHYLALPWFTQFISDPVPFYVYALWPQVSAEPTSTFIPGP